MPIYYMSIVFGFVRGNMKILFKKNSNKGFTLVELIVVLVILAILAALLVPTLIGYIDEARAKKYLPNAQACVEAAQAMFSQQFALNGDVPLGTPVVGVDQVVTEYGTNGDKDISGKEFATEVLRLAGMPDGKPYCFMVAVGSNSTGTTDREASLTDKYTVFYAFYQEEANSKPWYYYNGQWTNSNPRYNNSNDTFNSRNVVKATGIRLQYYVISNNTGMVLGDSFWGWLKSMK